MQAEPEGGKVAGQPVDHQESGGVGREDRVLRTSFSPSFLEEGGDEGYEK